MFLKGGLYLPVSSEFAKSLSSLDSQVTLERKDKPSEVQCVGRNIDDRYAVQICGRWMH